MTEILALLAAATALAVFGAGWTAGHAFADEHAPNARWGLTALLFLGVALLLVPLLVRGVLGLPPQSYVRPPA